jgi:hypothetical protein
MVDGTLPVKALLFSDIILHSRHHDSVARDRDTHKKGRPHSSQPVLTRPMLPCIQETNCCLFMVMSKATHLMFPGYSAEILLGMVPVKAQRCTSKLLLVFEQQPVGKGASMS